METTKKHTAASRLKGLLTDDSKGSFLIWCAVVVILCAVTGDTFLSGRNLANLIRYASFYVMVGMGVMVIFSAGEMDMSLGATMGMSGIVSAWLANQGYPLFVIVPAAVCVGLLLGACNGFCVGYLGLPAFIATLGSKQVIRGLINVFTKGYPINDLGDAFNNLGTGSFLGVPIPIYIAALLALCTWYLTKKTVLGRHMKATGSNRQAAIVSGINTKKNKLLAYMYGGAMAAIAGMVLTARLTTGLTATGDGFELEAICGAIIGGCSLGGGNGTVPGTIFGILVIYTVKNGMSLLSVDAYWQTVVQGCIVLLAVYLDIVRRRSKK